MADSVSWFRGTNPSACHPVLGHQTSGKHLPPHFGVPTSAKLLPPHFWGTDFCWILAIMLPGARGAIQSGQQQDNINNNTGSSSRHNSLTAQLLHNTRHHNTTSPLLRMSDSEEEELDKEAVGKAVSCQLQWIKPLKTIADND